MFAAPRSWSDQFFVFLIVFFVCVRTMSPLVSYVFAAEQGEVSRQQNLTLELDIQGSNSAELGFK